MGEVDVTALARHGLVHEIVSLVDVGKGAAHIGSASVSVVLQDVGQECHLGELKRLGAVRVGATSSSAVKGSHMVTLTITDLQILFWDKSRVSLQYMRNHVGSPRSEANHVQSSRFSHHRA